MSVINEMAEEIRRLRKKISPLEDPNFTAVLALKLGRVDLRGRVQKIRGKDHVVVFPRALYEELFNEIPGQHEVQQMTRSLLAMCWERYVKQGVRMMVMPLDEYLETLQ